jgi:hypothetical protein
MAQVQQNNSLGNPLQGVSSELRLISQSAPKVELQLQAEFVEPLLSDNLISLVAELEEGIGASHVFSRICSLIFDPLIGY